MGTVRDDRRRRVPILNYHRIRDEEGGPVAEFDVPLLAFRRQMAILKRLGFRPITMTELLDGWLGAGPLPRRPIAITFDDGYVDTVALAAPILDRLGFRATLFVVPRLVGTTAAWDAVPGRPGAPLAGWDDLRALRARGWEIGSHTASHADLTDLSAEAVAAEIADGSRLIGEALGVAPATLAYPFGRHSPAIDAAAAATGLRAAVTTWCTVATPDSPRFAIPRCTLVTRDSLAAFLAIVALGGRRPRAGLAAAARRIRRG